MTDPKKLVILGGGASGLLLAKILSSSAQKLNLEITLVDCKTFFEYTPSLCAVLYEKTDDQFKNHFRSITVDYASVLTPLHIRFVLGVVRELSDEKKVITLQDGTEVSYDHCIICTGSSYHAPWKTPCENNTTLQDRLDYLQSQRDQYKEAKQILCIGGGAVGVEVAGEICCRDPSKSVTLVNAQPVVLGGAPSNLGSSAQHILENMPSLTLISNERASSTDGRHYETDKSDTKIVADLVYQCTGIKPNTEFLRPTQSHWLDDKQFIKVDEFLKASNNVFAVGDCNSLDDPKMFFNAHMQAIHTAQNIKRILKGHEPTPYKGSRAAMMVSLGPSHAVGYTMGVTLNGWPFNRKQGSKIASISKNAIERITMDDLCLEKPTNGILYYTHEKGRFIPQVIQKICPAKQ
ncbi:hypothetical protein DFQ28_011067 [Apophysomyces sp. BC1034]|nr:hypothetical protein DFQ30_010804 [Apophysomyces sp. BC1015]KAG0169821.1 hypothetical protein DFQ29_009533 [Apophysomyces sp. BC1021]KAG0184485.1 hypothetical protein DFQ28_011067 [Apophysomyces sp. BC1034]